MGMQALTVRGIEALKPQAKRYEVFDALCRVRGARAQSEPILPRGCVR